MYFSTNSENLQSALQIVSGAVSSRHPLPILSGILLEVENDTLYVTGNDLEQGIRTSVPVTVKSSGSAVLPARQTIELIRRLPGQNIELQTDPETHTTVINYGDSELTLHGYPPDEYPLLPELKHQRTIPFSQPLLRKMLRQVLYAVSTDEHRPVFTGVLFEIENDRLRLVATDTHRLSLRTAALDENVEELINVVVPGKTLNELVKLLNQEDSNCNIHISDNHIVFLLENIQIVTRLLKGNFPNYNMAIPDSIETNVKVNCKELLDAVDRAMLLSSSSSKQNIILQLNDNALTVFLNSEKGTIREDIKVSSDGKNMDVGFNGRYLKEALKPIDSEEIYLQLTGPATPALIKPTDDEEYLSLLVPATPSTEGNE